MGLKGNLANIDHLRIALAKQPTTLAEDAARSAAPPITGETQKSFRTGETVYSTARDLGKGGEPLTLVKSGAVERQLGFTSIGTQLRAVLSTPYAKYLVGKYEILPNKSIPQGWRPTIKSKVDEAFDRYMRRMKAGSPKP